MSLFVTRFFRVADFSCIFPPISALTSHRFWGAIFSLSVGVGAGGDGVVAQGDEAMVGSLRFDFMLVSCDHGLRRYVWFGRTFNAIYFL